jgi:hypothetical protein
MREQPDVEDTYDMWVTLVSESMNYLVCDFYYLKSKTDSRFEIDRDS